jgi:hypothetical protein
MAEIRRILSIDGGGIKGAMPIAFLARVEEATGQRIVDHFDLIAGTSTGGIIALGLGLGVPAARILDFYRNEGPAIFGVRPIDVDACKLSRLAGGMRNFVGRHVRQARQFFAPKHQPDTLRSALQQVLGDQLLGESLTRLIIPAYHADRRTVYVFKTAHHPRLEIDHRVRAVDVALATAAAPTYFPAHSLPSGARIFDGGIWANNPMGMAMVEAIGVLGWDPHTTRLLSLGCGDEVVVADPEAGIVQLGRGVIDLMMQGQSFGALGTAKLLAGEHNIHRINPTVPKGLFSLDDTTKIDRLTGLGFECARDALPTLRREFLVASKEAFVPFHGSRTV